MRGHAEAFLAQHDQTFFPNALCDVYEPIGCLAEKAHVSTFLLSRREDGGLYVVKAYDINRFLESEVQLLQKLKHPGIPRLIAEYRTKTQVFVVRTYQAGKTLAELVRQHGPYDLAQATALMAQLCGIVAYLHAQTPPIVHRDIKAANVVLSDNGRLSLIDFEIARCFDPDAQADTVTTYTQAYAAPEQFGYAQTDGRSDIYAMGVLFLFLLTGDASINGIDSGVPGRQARRIIRRATAFAPQRRYPNVKAFQRALQSGEKMLPRRVALFCVAAISAVLLIAFGAWLGMRYTAYQMASAAASSLTEARFSSSILEQAVRLQLQKAPDEPITAADLARITGLYLYGDQPALDAKQYHEYPLNPDLYDVHWGDLTTLNDFKQFPNLRDLCIGYQPLADISGLVALSQLDHLNLLECKLLCDISPLAEVSSLRGLFLDGAAVRDISPLASMPLLRDLSLGATRVESLEPLRGHPGLRSLDIGKTDILDLTPLSTMPALKRVYAIGYAPQHFAALETQYEVFFEQK